MKNAQGMQVPATCRHSWHQTVTRRPAAGDRRRRLPKHRMPAPQRTTTIRDPLTLTINGVRYGGWKEARISRGIERFPSDFVIAVAERVLGEELVRLRPGATVDVRAGSDMLGTGYIDRVGHRISASDHAIAVAWRSKCQDLTDTSAELESRKG